MNTNPLVSIIIPTFNRAHLIAETLDSILAQTYANWECIIVDDGSNDDTDEVIDKYLKEDSRFQYHHRPDTHKSGGNGARNYGFELSKGEYINWFDDDDVMLENFIKSKIVFFKEQIDLVIATGYSVDEKLDIIQKIDFNMNSYLFKDYTLWNLKIFSPSVMFRKSFLKNHKLFNPNFTRSQETEFFSRIFYRLPDTSFFLTNVCTFYYRQHYETKSQKSKTGYNSNYMKCFILNSISNLCRGFELNDIDIVRFHYNFLLKYFFEGLNYQNKINSVFTLKGTFSVLIKYKFFKGLKFLFLGTIPLFTSIGRVWIKNKMGKIFN